MFSIKNSSIDNIQLDNYDGALIAIISIMIFAIFLPCLLWFFRNFNRIVLKKNYEFLNKSIKWSFILGIAVFLICVVLLILKMKGYI